MPQVVIAITSGTRWRVPVDCTSATIEVIGGGGVGGGAYSKTTSVSLTPLSLVYVNIGSGGSVSNGGGGANTGGGDTWFNKTTNAAPSSTTNGALAKGGGVIPSCGGGSAPGGLSSGGVGDVGAKFSGGDGYGTWNYCGGNYDFII
jgi:hypothetical protein